MKTGSVSCKHDFKQGDYDGTRYCARCHVREGRELSETSLFKQLAESLVRRGIALNDGGANVTVPALMEAFRTVEREALEKCKCRKESEDGTDR